MTKIQVANFDCIPQAVCKGCDRVYTDGHYVRKLNFYIKQQPIPALSAILETALEHQQQEDELDLSYGESLGNKITYILF